MELKGALGLERAGDWMAKAVPEESDRQSSDMMQDGFILDED
jgi:hypothetical protein